MTKFEELSSEEQAIIDFFKLSLEYIDASDKLYIQHLSTKEKMLREMLYFKYEEEPFSFFKKAHQKWEMEIDDLEKQLHDIYLKFEVFFQEQQEFYKKLIEV